MKKPKKARSTLSAQEIQLVEQLRKNPTMMARVQRILDLADNAEGPLKSADDLEDALVEEMRRLGNETMHHWAVQAEERVAQELQGEQPGKVRSRKKKH